MSTKTTRHEECRGDIAKAALISLLRCLDKLDMTMLLSSLYCFFNFCHVLRIFVMFFFSIVYAILSGIAFRLYDL